MSVRLSRSFQLQIPCETKYVSLARKCVRLVAESVGFDEKECRDIELAVDEAVSNSVVHGRPQVTSPAVTIKCRTRPGTITIEVQDQGRGECVPDSMHLPADTQEHGRGTAIIRKLMDEVRATCTPSGLNLKMSKKHRISTGKKPPRITGAAYSETNKLTERIRLFAF